MEKIKTTIFLVLRSEKYHGYFSVDGFLTFSLAVRHVEKMLLTQDYKNQGFKRVSKTKWVSEDGFENFVIVRRTIRNQ